MPAFQPYEGQRLSRAELAQLQEEKLRKQVRYVYERSKFYQKKWAQAGITAEDIKTLGDLKQLPFTTKDELREIQSKEPPLGENQCVHPEEIIRIHSSSGTTGRPTYVGITRHDDEVWREIAARVFYTEGIRPNSVVVFAMGLSFFVGGLPSKDAIEHIGATFIPIGTGASHRVVTSIQHLNADVMICTPSYAIYLAEYIRSELGLEPKDLGIKLIGTGGEPGGGLPEMRKRIEKEWGCRVVEAMGNADMAPILFAECEHQNGMHFVADEFVICELIDPQTGESLAFEDGSEGELVYTAIDRECVPLLRFRTRDRIKIFTSPCACGRAGFRIRCVGRTDDMLIVRGVNVFPSAIRDVINSFRPLTTGEIQIQLGKPGPAAEPPLPIVVEYGTEVPEEELPGLKARLEHELRAKLIFTSEIQLVPASTLPRFEMKAKLTKELY
jgi:phenylacetate-CoA ligase